MDEEELQRKLDLALRERDAARRTIEENYLVQHRLNTRIKELEDTLKLMQRKLQRFSVCLTAEIMEVFRAD